MSDMKLTRKILLIRILWSEKKLNNAITKNLSNSESDLRRILRIIMRRIKLSNID